jgi:large subunit ribosomal protein L3
MIRGILGRKIGQSQMFASDGKRKTVTLITAGPCYVTQIKEIEKDGYSAIQLGLGQRKAGIKKTPRFLVEIRNPKSEIRKNGEQETGNGQLKLGQEITVDKVFSVGDTVKVSGIAKGKGFAGVVKRWKFKGGPRTHGQSDRERAPGSIGQGTTPGRVFKGKKMAGRMGGGRVSVRGLKVLKVEKDKNLIVVSGLVPGARKGLLEIYKI